MISVTFPEANLELAKDQPEYETLHVFVEERLVNIPTDDGKQSVIKSIPWSMTACFELTDEEIAEIVATRKIWHRQMLFGNSFQPILMSTSKLILEAAKP
jgi:hypothetical protein